MKLGIIGLPQSGRSTIFSALTGARSAEEGHGVPRTDARIATIVMYDDRVDFLSEMFQPKKTTYARMEYLLPSEIQSSALSKSEGGIWSQVRPCDALLHVVRNFKGLDGSSPAPEQDFWKLEEEMVLTDLVVVEKRLERIDLDKKRGKKPDEEEYSALQSCKEVLEKGQSLRSIPEISSHPFLKGFTLLSAKPMLVIINNEDEDEIMPKWNREPSDLELLVVRGRLEEDIASMPPEDAEEFLEAYHIRESVLDRVIKSSHRLLNRLSFFTVSPEEVRAWSVTDGTPALKAAGTVHSDMEKGFIRAETLSFDDLKACGTFQDAKKAGLVRLEGKEYMVRDGDIIKFRFNV